MLYMLTSSISLECLWKLLSSSYWNSDGTVLLSSPVLRCYMLNVLIMRFNNFTYATHFSSSLSPSPIFPSYSHVRVFIYFYFLTGDASGLSSILLGSSRCSLAVVLVRSLRGFFITCLSFSSGHRCFLTLAHILSKISSIQPSLTATPIHCADLLPPTFDTLAILDCTVAGLTDNWGRLLCLLHSRRLSLVSGFCPRLQQLSRSV